jgi:hypothetical protein
MLFLSPSVQTSESDQTLYVVEKSNKVGAISGAFQWGPVDAPTLITNGEAEFVSKFGIPNNATAKYVMPILDFFAYSNSAWIVRQVGPTALNAAPGTALNTLVKNDDSFATLSIPGADYIAKYPGVAGNGLSINIASSVTFPTWELANRFAYTPRSGEFAIAVVDTTGYWTGVAAAAQQERLVLSGVATATTVNAFGVAVTVLVGDTAAQVAAKIAATSGVSTQFVNLSVTGSTLTYQLPAVGYHSVATQANIDPVASGITGANDVVKSGTIGGILETYEIMESSPTAKFADGTTKYWYDAINQRSKYIRAVDKSVALVAKIVTLVGGVDDQVVIVNSGYQQLVNREAYDLQFLIVPDVTEAEQKAIIDVAETRGDCMAFVAPRQTDVVNNRNNEVAAVKDWRINRLNRDSTYAFAVDNWGYMFDKYNSVYRWVPATGGTAGIAARSFVDNDPWISFAGLTRGKYRNYSKMAWTASEDSRNALYPVGVNSIVTFPSEGIVLFGDKTLTQRPSSFGHVNVRWAFIVAKASLVVLARQFLFENNDEFTRAQFVNAAKPFLRNMKTRRAFEDFQVVCNATNNSGDVRITNKMVVQVSLKPEYSINWVVLNLSAVRPDVVFTETE